MNKHEQHPAWSAQLYDLAAKLARLDGLDPDSPYINVDGTITICGSLGPFLNIDFYLAEAAESVPTPR